MLGGLFESAPEPAASPRGGALGFSFNQDGSCLAIGTRDGFRVYGLQPFARAFSSKGGGQKLAEMLGCSSLICLVGAGEAPALSPRCLRLYDLRARKVLTEVSFAAAVNKVVLNRSRLAAACPGAVYVFDLRSMECLRALDLAAESAAGALSAETPTPGNAADARGRRPHSPADSHLMVLSSESARNPCLLATPTTFTGEILLFDTIRLRTVHKFIAHKTPLSCLAISDAGDRLCSASVTGTVIRVFSVPEGELQAQLRRGLQAAQIYSLCFSPSGRFLACASSSGTIHVFDLKLQVSKDEMHRAAVQIHPPVPPGIRTVCRLVNEQARLQEGVAVGLKLLLRIVSHAGVFYEYEAERSKSGTWATRLTSENLFFADEEEDEEGEEEERSAADVALEEALKDTKTVDSELPLPPPVPSEQIEIVAENAG